MKPAAVPYKKLKSIRLILLDVDGILTDGRIYLGSGPSGDLFEMKAFHALDGHGLILASRLGYEVGLVTSRDSALVSRRARELGIPHVFQNIKDKWPVVRQFLARRHFKPRELLFMGDDLMDLPVLTAAGFSATVPEAPQEVRSRVDYVTDASGGLGAVREVMELLFKAQGKWSRLVSSFVRR